MWYQQTWKQRYGQRYRIKLDVVIEYIIHLTTIEKVQRYHERNLIRMQNQYFYKEYEKINLTFLFWIYIKYSVKSNKSFNDCTNAVQRDWPFVTPDK